MVRANSGHTQRSCHSRIGEEKISVLAVSLVADASASEVQVRLGIALLSSAPGTASGVGGQNSFQDSLTMLVRC